MQLTVVVPRVYGICGYRQLCFYFVPHLSNFFCLCTVCSNCRALLLFFSCTRLLHTYTIVLLPPLLLHNLLLQWYVIDISELYPFSQFLKQYSYFGFIFVSCWTVLCIKLHMLKLYLFQSFFDVFSFFFQSEDFISAIQVSKFVIQT